MTSNSPAHPDESLSLRYLDGELTGREASELRRHLDGCWQCRRNLMESQTTINTYLRLREKVLGAADPPPGIPWLPFDQLSPPPATPPPVRWWNVWKLAAMSAALVLTLLASVYLARNPVPKPLQPTSPVAVTLPRAAPPRSRPPSPPAPVPVPEAALSPLPLQVRAAQILHELGADLGEPVVIVSSATQALVRANGLDPRRRQTIAAALAIQPGIEFQNIDPVASVPAAASPPTPAQPLRPKLFHAQLLNRLGSPAAVESFANAILDDSDSIAVRAHSLSTLAELFPPDARLTASERAIVNTILATHRATLRRHVQSIRNQLRPFLPAAAPAENAAGAAQAGELDRLLNAAFAGAPLALSDPELAARIQTLLQALDE